MAMPWTIDRIGPLGLAILAAAPAGSRAEERPRQDGAAVEFFEKKVRPLLADNCYNCHSANTNAKGGLRTDDRNGLLQGGNSGPAVVPGKPEESLLLQAVRHKDGAPKMPPKKRLTAREVAVLDALDQGRRRLAEVEVPHVGRQAERRSTRSSGRSTGPGSR